MPAPPERRAPPLRGRAAARTGTQLLRPHRDQRGRRRLGGRPPARDAARRGGTGCARRPRAGRYSSPRSYACSGSGGRAPRGSDLVARAPCRRAPTRYDRRPEAADPRRWESPRRQPVLLRAARACPGGLGVGSPVLLTGPSGRDGSPRRLTGRTTHPRAGGHPLQNWSWEAAGENEILLRPASGAVLPRGDTTALPFWATGMGLAHHSRC